ncbi:MAG: PDZ domain-containing protein, partial [Nitrospirales bacterium]
MNRRSFLRGATGAILALTRSGQVAEALEHDTTGALSSAHPQNSIVVSTTGDDRNPGTISRPLKSFQAAQAAVRKLKKEHSGTLSVYFRAGTYYLPDTIVFTPEDSGKTGAPIIYAPYPGEQVLLSGGSRLSPKWTPYRDGIMKTFVPSGTATDQLFVNGQLQILARYPNYDANAKYLNGYAPDVISPERVQRWADPRGAYMHALHQ